MNYLLGIDAGTTSMKGILIDENGKKTGLVSMNYELDVSGKFGVELDACNYWEAFRKVVKTIIETFEINPKDITGIAVDSQGETLICLDKNGEPLRKAIVWLDNRSSKEAEEIRLKFGIEKTFFITGQPEVVATWPATKILWLSKNEKNIFDKTDKYLLVSDYINYKLTGKYVTSSSLISSTLYFDIRKNQWWDEMLNYMGIHDTQLPNVVYSGVQIGNLSDKASKETGLYQNTIVVTGTLDQMAGAIGAGNINSETVSESTGTCLAMCVGTKYPIPYKEDFMIPCHCHALHGEYCLIFWSQTAGVILEWYKDNFYNQDIHSKYESYNTNDIYKGMDNEAAGVNPGSEGLILLPNFCGSAAPYFNPKVKGVIFGVTLNHTRAHFSRAIMESVGFMLREHIETAERFKINIKEIRSLGGGSKSALWNQIKADITGKEIVTLEDSETASLGSAMLAGIGTGIFKSIQDACNKCIRVKDRYYPDVKNAAIYHASYEKYKKLYASTSLLY